MVDDVVKNYIRELLERGYDTRTVRKMFLKQGYSFSEIDDIIKTISNEISFEKEFLDKGHNKSQENSSQLAQSNSTSIPENANKDSEELKNLVKSSFSRLKSKNNDDSLYAGNDDYSQTDGKASYRNGRPPREIMHQTLKDMSGRFDNHNRILIFGAVFLIIVLIAALGAVIFMYLELKENLSNDNTNNNNNNNNIQQDNENETVSDDQQFVPFCGYCEYFTGDECIKYNCCDNSDCDDNDDNTTDRCLYPATKDSRCSNIHIRQIEPGKTDDEKKESNNSNNNNITKTSDEPIREDNSCTENSDCDDNNPATSDMCLGSPNKVCVWIPITTCKPNDNYCPPNCNENNDPDCVQ
ncbi:MAG: hypothetical protein ACLFUO_03315 [Candidatus Woesearchaeota archaeon]